MKAGAEKLTPEEFILAALSPEQRLEAAFRVWGSAAAGPGSGAAVGRGVCLAGTAGGVSRGPQALLAVRKITAEQFRSLVAGIAAFVSEARMLVPTQPVRVRRNRKDDMVLECCLAARAHSLIAGDRDLLDLEPGVVGVPALKRLRIVTPRSYVDEVVRRRP